MSEYKQRPPLSRAASSLARVGRMKGKQTENDVALRYCFGTDEKGKRAPRTSEEERERLREWLGESDGGRAEDDGVALLALGDCRRKRVS